MLDINVWDNEQLSKTVPVRPDGMISLPLLGDVPAAGKTALQLKQELGSRLSRYVDKPEVTVTLSAINSYKVFVQGHVTNTGAYPITGTSTITQAISLAGGFTQFADENGIVILRGSGSGTEKIRVKYKRIIAGKDPDVAVLPGDTIVVP
ncbi:MAG: polysaccharide biosynthesis/export family protein [Deltaproteobacteria bacterium]|nr:polysaccharide biosynthesis/export family protein [Deltaproteobacteria bacterium]